MEASSASGRGRWALRAMQAAFALGLASAVQTVARPASAHLILYYPPPRSAGIVKDSYSQVSPCGGYPKTDAPTILKAGDTITIEGHVNPHTNKFRVALSPDDAHFDENVIGIYTADADSNYDISFPMTLPNKECIGCTLQVVMWDVQWYACADVSIYTGTPPDAGTRPPADGGTRPPQGVDAGTKPTSKPTTQDAGHTQSGGSGPAADGSAELAADPSGDVNGVACTLTQKKRTSAPAMVLLALGLVWWRRRR